jgi:hypothetical protein
MMWTNFTRTPSSGEWTIGTNFTRSPSSGEFDLVATQDDVLLSCTSPQTLTYSPCFVLSNYNDFLIEIEFFINSSTGGCGYARYCGERYVGLVGSVIVAHCFGPITVAISTLGASNALNLLTRFR